MGAFTVKQAEELYQVGGWGDGYFRVDGRGRLCIRPDGVTDVPLPDVIDRLNNDGVPNPIVLRFPQILRHRIDRINEAFNHALRENGLRVGGARYRGVFPIKVNQRKEVVQEVAKAGRRWQYGLEVGSKAELVAALTMDPGRKSLLVVNGFKDQPYLEAACHATAFKDEVIIVLDEVGELPHLIPLLDAMEHPPILGIRLKLRTQAPGKWALSGGEKAKFGLTIPEVLWAVQRLREAGHIDRLQMLHFHIGSQISHIRRIAEGVREATRLYTELARMDVPLRLLDVGGGLAVDHDGSASSAHTSCNYTIEEYANTVVATIKDVCDEAKIAMPDIISESGRAAVAHHAVLVTNVLRRVPMLQDLPDRQGDSPAADDPTPLQNLYEMRGSLTAKNCFEVFHDAVQARDDLNALFDLGHLRLAALGRAEALLRRLFKDIKGHIEAQQETDSEEYGLLRSLLGQKLVCNFSLFQSIPDVWGIRQQFPILPIHRLRERPTEMASLADITCDSDGEIRHFTDIHGTRGELPVHALRPGEPYHLAICLVGAYQDSLGDYHNLFGETAEAIIEANDGEWSVGRVTEGSAVGDMLAWVRYDPRDLKRRIGRRIKRLHDSGRLTNAEAARLRSRYDSLIDSHTYLEVRREPE